MFWVNFAYLIIKWSEGKYYIGYVESVQWFYDFVLYILSGWFSLTFLPLLISLLGIIGKEERRFPHYSNKDDKYVYTEIDSVYFECVVADGSYHRYVGMHHQSGYIFKDGGFADYVHKLSLP